MRIRNLSSRFSLFALILMMSLVIVACSGDADESSDTLEETTTEETTDEVVTEDEDIAEVEPTAETSEETSDETEDSDTSEDTSEESDDAETAGEARIVITGLTSEEEEEVTEGYPCELIAVIDSEGQSGSRVRNIILNEAEVGALSIRTVVNDEVLVADEHLINAEGVWYRLIVNTNTFYGWIQEQYVALTPDCPFYDFE